jgi:hypothetical protein
MGMMIASLSGSLLTAVGALTILVGALSPTQWASSQVDLPDLGIIPVTSTLTTGHII